VDLRPVDPRFCTITDATDAASLDEVRVLMREYASMPHAVTRWSTADADIRALPGPFAAPGLLLLATDAEGAQGCGGVRLIAELPGAAEIKRVYVRSRARGRGIGEALMRALMAHAVAQGCTRVVLDTAPDLAAARSLYARLGFGPIPAYSTTLAPDVICFEWRPNAENGSQV
jgi:putative acetyltransferase